MSQIKSYTKRNGEIIFFHDVEDKYLQEGETIQKLMKHFKIDQAVIQEILSESENEEVTEKLNKRKIHIDIDMLFEEYLQDGETTHTLANKYGCDSKTIGRRLKKSKNEKVLNKLKLALEKITEKRPSNIYIKNDMIYVIANNTGTVHFFNYTKQLYNQLSGHNWNERPNGHLGTIIDNEDFNAYWFIMGKPEKGFVIDHKNRKAFDNTINNLRVASNAENRINTKINKNNKTGYKGVCYDKKAQDYRAYIWADGKNIELGHYNSPEEAYAARAIKEFELFGDFANIHDDFKHLVEKDVGGGEGVFY